MKQQYRRSGSAEYCISRGRESRIYNWTAVHFQYCTVHRSGNS